MPEADLPLSQPLINLVLEHADGSKIQPRQSATAPDRLIAELEAEASRLRLTIEELQAQMRVKDAEHQVYAAERERRQQEIQAERDSIELALSGLAKAAQTLRSERRQLQTDLQRAVGEIAAAVATRLTHDKVNAGDHAVQELVKKCVERLDSTDSITIRLHPDDIELLNERIKDDPETLASCPAYELNPDQTLSRGSCVVSTGDITVQNRLDEQLAEIRQQLLEI